MQSPSGKAQAALRMRVVEAKFLVSAAGPTDGVGYPAEAAPEIAFVGRSNVGKSTLLQALLGRRGLVRTSRDPGRTRLVNFFEAVVMEEPGVTRAVRLVDLPGFGYAKASREERAKFRPIVQQYLEGRTALKAAALLVDLRRGAEVEEIDLARFLAGYSRQVIAVGTKADKLSKHERKPATEKLAKQLGLPVCAVSGDSGEGLEALWRRLLVAVGPA